MKLEYNLLEIEFSRQKQGTYFSRNDLNGVTNIDESLKFILSIYEYLAFESLIQISVARMSNMYIILTYNFKHLPIIHILHAIMYLIS